MEEFKKIDEFDNYSVSNFGRVINDKTGRIIKAVKDSYGYLIVCLYKNKIPKNFKIHRLIGIAFIENVNDCETIDHVNRNRLDNRLDNLRWANHSQNSSNRGKQQNTSSQFIGVYFNKASNKWKSHITINNKQNHLGYFNTELEASEFRQKYILENNLQEFYN
jgi:hypothetical protein